VSFRAPRLAAAALVAAALAPSPAAAATASAAERVAAAERLAREVERNLSAVERSRGGADEAAAAAASRRCGEGRALYERGEWADAAVLLAQAVDEPGFRDSPDLADATFLLADALRRAGDCGAARPRYRAYLATGADDRRPEAVTGALDCAVRERRTADVGPLLDEAERQFGSELPSELVYLSGKTAFQRTDLPAAERLERAESAFERVGPPLEPQAAYWLGVVEIEKGNLAGSLSRFDRCARWEPKDRRQAQVRDLCMLALGRVHAEMGNAEWAREWYERVAASPSRFAEASYELAWAYVKARQYERALRTASFIADLAPESPLAPEARLLQGQLLLELGRFSEAVDAYDSVINAYAPVRDELDAILAMHEDPLRYFNELVGRRGQALDVGAVLPPVAARWASSSDDVAAGLELVRTLDAARKAVLDGADAAARVELLLDAGAGLGAFPGLQLAYASAEAIENDATWVEGQAVVALSDLAEGSLQGDWREALERARAARRALEPAMAALPRTAAEVRERRARLQARIDRVEAEAFRTGLRVDGLDASVGGTEAFVERHRAEIDADPEGRQELEQELRRHREAVDAYEAQLRSLRQEIAGARDAAGGADALEEDARVRAEYVAALEEERVAAGRAKAPAAAPDRAAFDRVDAMRARLAELRARAGRAKRDLAAEAGRRAGWLRERLSAERTELAAEEAALDGAQADARELVGRIAYRALSDVRAQFYALVLKADVGVVDVAWSRKRARLDRIQQLSMQKAAELEQLDREYRALGREQD